MDLANVLHELWRLRWWVAGGLVVAAAAAVLATHRVTLSPLAVEGRAYQYGVASTQVLVESNAVPVVDVTSIEQPLANQATVFAQIMSSAPVLDRVAGALELPPGTIAAEQPLLPQGERETSVQRAADVASESRAFRLRFATSKDLPIITVFAQGPTAAAAAQLADRSVRAFRDYMSTTQVARRVPPERQFAVRQLGPAGSGTVNAGTGASMAVLAFGGAFVGWCVLVLLVSSVARNWQGAGTLNPLEARRPS